MAISTGIAPRETSRRREPAKGIVDGLGRLYGHVVASLPRYTPPRRAEAVAQLPHGLHVQPLALEDDLAAGLVLSVLEALVLHVEDFVADHHNSFK